MRRNVGSGYGRARSSATDELHTNCALPDLVTIIVHLPKRRRCHFFNSLRRSFAYMQPLKV